MTASTRSATRLISNSLKILTAIGFLLSPALSQAQDTLLMGDAEANLKVKNDRLAGGLRELYQQSNNAVATATVAAEVGATVIGGRVGVDIVARRDAAGLASQLRALGAEQVSVFGYVISAWVPIDMLERVAALSDMRQINLVQASTRTGSVTSQGDEALEADVARAVSGVDGSGVTVGVLSDSFDCTGDAATDVLTGDLPEGIISLDDRICPASDEGRAMMQIVSDVAPGADLAFHTAFGGQADFAIGIMELAEQAQAKVIVDDVFYFAEPFFQDGIIAQAVDRVEAMGAAYFSSAGNSARDSYESDYRSSGIGLLWGADGDAHDFDPTENVDVLQEIIVPSGQRIVITLQWDEPFASVSGMGAGNDLDLLLLDKDGLSVIAGSASANIDSDPVEVLGFTNTSLTETVFNLAIERYTIGERSPVGKIKYINFSGPYFPQEYATQSSTVVGHANAAGAMAVGAVRYDQTPAFGVNPPLLEPFSSAGITPILFDLRGNRVSISRDKPDFTAPDGGNNTFFGTDFEGDLFPNFFGTSAAAPHAAGVAALMLEQNDQLSPGQVRERLIASTVDMATPGFDSDTGHGLIVATAALDEPEKKLPELSIRDAIVHEADGVADVRVELNEISSSDVSVKVFSIADSATAGRDYYGAFRILTIKAGTRSATARFVILDDNLTETTERFFVRAVKISEAKIVKKKAIVVIKDDDGKP